MNQQNIVDFLEGLGTLPKLVSAGLQYLGVKEIKGAANNPIIMDMARGLGLQNIYVSDDKQAWCALFVNHLIRITGKPVVDYGGDKYNLLRAKWLMKWGYSVPKQDAVLGDVVIIDREGGGHDFILIGFTPEGNWVGLGGNQNNQVSIAEFDDERVISVRRYFSKSLPESAKRYLFDSTGIVSTNEA